MICIHIGRMIAFTGLLLLASVLVPGGASAQTSPPSYAIVSLGEQIPGATSGAALAVNESSDTVGYVAIGSASWEHVPFVYTAEHGAVLLPRPSWAVTARARDVSDRHSDGTIDIVGWAANSIYSGDLAVRWKYSTLTGALLEMVELGTLNQLPQSQATDVNAGGDIVGYSTGFMQFDGAATWFAPTGPEQIGGQYLYGIADVTDSRWVLVKAGFAATAHRYHLTTGELVDVGVPPGRLYTSTGAAMNESLQVAATATTGNTDPRGQYITQVWRHSVGEGWKYIAGGGSSIDHARGINNRGDVIAQIVGGLTYFDLLYIDSLDAVFIIEDLLGPGFEGASIGALNDINDVGEIAASGAGGPILLIPIGNLEVPPAPTGLSATPHPPTQQQPFTSIELAWTGSGPLAQGYSVERALAGSASFGEIGTTGATTYRDMTVSEGVTYDYRVRAAGAAGFSPYSNVATATAPTPTADNDPPTVQFLAPEDGSSQKRPRRMNVIVSVADTGGVESLRITAAGPSSSEICFRTLSGQTNAEVTCGWNTGNVGYGNYTLTAMAVDRFGNSSSTSVSITFTRRTRR